MCFWIQVYLVDTWATWVVEIYYDIMWLHGGLNLMQTFATADVIILGGSSKGTRDSGYLATFFLNLWGNAADLPLGSKYGNHRRGWRGTRRRKSEWMGVWCFCVLENWYPKNPCFMCLWMFFCLTISWFAVIFQQREIVYCSIRVGGIPFESFFDRTLIVNKFSLSNQAGPGISRRESCHVD